MHKNGYKFVIGVKKNIKFISNEINKTINTIQKINNFCTIHNVYCLTKTAFINFSSKHNQPNYTEKRKFKVYIHIYFDPKNAEKEKIDFIKRIKTAINKCNNRTATDQERLLVSKYCTFEPHSNNKFITSIDYDSIDYHAATL